MKYILLGIQKITKNISAEVIEKIFLLIDEVNEKNIDKILHELDKYGLLGNFSIEEARKFVTGSRLQKIFNKNFAKFIGEMNHSKYLFNTICFFSTGGFTWSFFPMNLFPMYMLYKLWNAHTGSLVALFILLTLCLGYVPHPTTIAFWKVSPTLFGIYGKSAILYTCGLFDEKHITTTEEDIYAITIGFTGIIITAVLGGFLRRCALGFTIITYAYT